MLTSGNVELHGRRETNPLWQWLRKADRVASTLGKNKADLVRLVRWLTHHAQRLEGTSIDALFKNLGLWDRMTSAGTYLAKATYLDKVLSLARASPLTSDFMRKVCHVASAVSGPILKVQLKFSYTSS
jgi:hypothetical protein